MKSYFLLLKTTVIAFCVLFTVPSFGLRSYEILTGIQKRMATESMAPEVKQYILTSRPLPVTMTHAQMFYNLDTFVVYSTRRKRELPPTLAYILEKRKDIMLTSDNYLDTFLDLYVREIDAQYVSMKTNDEKARGSMHEEAVKNLPENIVVPTAVDSDTYQSIVVDISDQRLYAFEEGVLVASSPITSGKKGFSTVRGDFQVQKKKLGRTLVSPFKDKKNQYRLHVDYWMQFYKGFGIHDACNSKNCWRQTFGGSDYVTRGSHGCVNAPYEFMGWLFDWSLEGTRVSVIQ